MDTLRTSMKLLFGLGAGMVFITFVWFIFVSMYPNVSTKSLLSFMTSSSTKSTESVEKKKKVKTKSDDWLPAPVNVADLFRRSPAQGTTTNLYVAPPPYDGSSNTYKNTNSQQPFNGYSNIYANSGSQQSSNYSYIVYTSSGTQVQRSDGGKGAYDLNTGEYITAYKGTANEAQVKQEPRALSTDEIRALYLRNLSIYNKIAISKGFTFTGEAREVMFNKSGSFPLVIIDNLGKVGVIGVAQATTDWAIPGWVRFKATINATLPKNVSCTLVFESAQTQASTGKPLRFPYNVICNG
jgi:hypothetical protein